MKTSPVMLISRCTKVAAILLLAMSSCCARKHAEEMSRAPGTAVTSGGESNLPPAAEAKSSSAPANESPPVLFENKGLSQFLFDEPDLRAIAVHLELTGRDGWMLGYAILTRIARDHPAAAVAVEQAFEQLDAITFRQRDLHDRLEKLRGVAPLARIAPVTAILEEIEGYDANVRWMFYRYQSLLDLYQPLPKALPKDKPKATTKDKPAAPQK